MGAIATLINYSSFISCIGLGLHYILAATISTLLTLASGYFLHRNVTFRMARTATLREFMEYIGLFILQYVLGIIDYIALIGHFRMNPSLAFVINSAIMAVMSFFVLKRFTFGQRRWLQTDSRRYSA